MPDKLTPRFEILVDGTSLKSDVMEKIVSISVRQDLVLADSIEVRLANDDLQFVDSDAFAEGKKLEVKLGYVETSLVLAGTGTIARRECEFPERGPAQITVVAYDKRFTLKHGTHVRAWTNVKDSDVVSQLCSAAGLTGDVDDTGFQHKYLFQPSQTDLAYICERGLQLGYVVRLDRAGQKLSFKKPAPGGAPGLTFSWGKNLLSFRPRFTTSDQPGPVTVRGFDMNAKAPVIARATKGDLDSTMGLSVVGAARSDQAFGEREVLVTGAVTTRDEAEAMAKAYVNQKLQNFAEGSGSVQGDPAVEAGSVIELQAIGTRTSGKYFVTSTFHHFEPRGFVTYFECTRPGESPSGSPPPAPPPPPPPPPPAGGGFSAKVGHVGPG